MKLLLKVINIDQKTQLCFSDEGKYTVDWGFCDGIKKTGLLLFPSILRYNSAVIMKNLSKKQGKTGNFIKV